MQMHDSSRLAPDSFNLDAVRYPVRVDLELSESLHGELCRLSTTTGRSLEEIILEAIDKELSGP
jgi:predicted DNA-binding protein